MSCTSRSPASLSNNGPMSPTDLKTRNIGLYQCAAIWYDDTIFCLEQKGNLYKLYFHLFPQIPIWTLLRILVNWASELFPLHRLITEALRVPRWTLQFYILHFPLNDLFWCFSFNTVGFLQGSGPSTCRCLPGTAAQRQRQEADTSRHHPGKHHPSVML